MKRKNLKKHLLALALALCLMLQCAFPMGAAASDQRNAQWNEISGEQVTAALIAPEAAAPETETAQQPAQTEQVRVSIVLEQPSLIEQGYPIASLVADSGARTYRSRLEQTQKAVARRISVGVLDGQPLDTQWNLTLAANLISANVPYGKLEAIAAVEGVKAVYVENRYEIDTPLPGIETDTVTAGTMTGTEQAWQTGYTGAGTRIAIIDTGTDTDHQSFDADALRYSLTLHAADAVASGKAESVETWLAELDLLDTEELAQLLSQLNAYKRAGKSLTAEELYVNEKLPFAFNYVDGDLDVTHDNDSAGEHGSHVAGIAAANSYIPDGYGGYTTAADTVYAVGQAPDAQIITMKVQGKGGGIYDSDYMAALEDALLLGCDAVNMSFGSSSVGYTYSTVEYYNSIYENLQDGDTVVANSGGNAYSYARFANTGSENLYADDVNNGRIGSPAAYPNAMSVASVDNTGYTGPTSTFAGTDTVTCQVTDAASVPQGYQNWNRLDPDELGTEYEFVFLGDPAFLLADAETDAENYLGKAEDFEGLELTGKVVLVARGSLNFSEKHSNAAAAGAAAVLIYNNTTGTINMDITASAATIPCGTVSLETARKIFAAANRNGDGSYSGKLTIKSGISLIFDTKEMVMSDFSSWGVPDDLSMKPEITAPGGNIYSVNGLDKSGTAYESMSGTSMAAPQIAGMSAVLAQYIEENGLSERTGVSARTLMQSLLMGTAVPVTEAETGLPYSVRKQGAGLANVSNALSAGAFLLLDEDGKVKVEFGDDPVRTGSYEFSFSINNLTDSELRYSLDAVIMAPGISGDGVCMLDTMEALSPALSYTTSLDPVVELFYDFDGDGDVDSDDAQALLDYVAGARSTLCNAEHADLSGSGTVDAYDVHLLLEYLDRGENAPVVEKAPYITVPGDSSVTVHVVLRLSDADRSYIEVNFPNGTYVEGYVNLTSVADDEGRMDVDQSIAVLGFYGGWSESSMFDRGEWTSDCYNALAGTPTAHYTTTEFSANYMTTLVEGEQYRYGLNLFAVDDAYLPERASLNAQGSNAIARIHYTLIRNSAASRLRITDDATGQVYYEADYGQQAAAFYYLNAGQWYNTDMTAAVSWSGTDAQGQPLPDGTRVTVSLTCASEYYRKADGTIDWDALDEGAAYTMPVLIDNEAPELNYAYQVVDALTGESTLQLEIQDNHYSAAVMLLNASGTKLLGTAPINQTEEGAAMDIDLTLDGIIGTEFIIAVADYAANIRYYEVTIVTDSSSGSFVAFNDAADSWVSFGSGVDANETVVAASDSTFLMGDCAEGYVFAVDSADDLYAIALSDMRRSERVKNLYYDYMDLAYDEATATLYGLRNYGNGRSYLYSISVKNGAEQYVRTLAADLCSLAAMGDGNFLSIASDGTLYRVEDADLTALGNVGTTVTGGQSTTYADGLLYWVSGMDLLAVSAEDATVQDVGTFSSTTTCLVHTAAAGSGVGDSSTATGLTLSQTAVETFVGNELQLTAVVRPWYVADRSVTWTSSDENVATIDADGVLRAVGAGTAVITAASAQTPEVTAACQVTVKALELTVNAAADVYGLGNLLRRDLTAGEMTMTPVSGLLGVNAATYDAVSGSLWVMDDSATIYQVDEATGAIVNKVPSGSGVVVSDMEYSHTFGGYFSVMESWLLVPTEFGTNAPASGFDFGDYLSDYTGATSFISVTSLGTVENQGKTCEQLLCMDNAGYLWMILPYQNGGGYGAFLQVLTSGLVGSIGAQTRASGIYEPSYGTAGGLMVSLCGGDGTCTLYLIDLSNTNNVLEIGTMGENICPVALYQPAATTAAPEPELPLVAAVENAIVIEAEPVRAG